MTALTRRVETVEGVDCVRLVGSQARGDPTPLSDWDFEVDTTEFDAVAAALPGAVAPLEPLASFWDPLGARPNFTVLLDGPVKVDLIFAGHPFTPSSPSVPGPTTLTAMDTHFWDWALWLGAKALRGERALVARELGRLYQHLLGPMGVRAEPDDLAAAVATYQQALTHQEARFGISVDPRLGTQAARALAAVR